MCTLPHLWEDIMFFFDKVIFFEFQQVRFFGSAEHENNCGVVEKLMFLKRFSEPW